ncbi:hypothetical protein WDU94_009480 [Cyamophila willieti]
MFTKCVFVVINVVCLLDISVHADELKHDSSDIEKLGALQIRLEKIATDALDRNGCLKYYSDYSKINEENPESKKLDRLQNRIASVKAKWGELRTKYDYLMSKKDKLIDLSEENILSGQWTNIKYMNAKAVHKENINSIDITFNNKKDIRYLELLFNKYKHINESLNVLKKSNEHYFKVTGSHVEFKSLVGSVRVLGDTFINKLNLTKSMNSVPIEDVIENAFRLDQKNKIKGSKTMSCLEAKHLYFQKISDINNITISSEDFNSIQEVIMSKTIKVEDDISFQNPVTIKGEVNILNSSFINDIETVDF